MRITDGASSALGSVQDPIRAELFGSERLERHAESLAAADRPLHKPSRGRDLLPRVRDNARALLDAYHSSVEAVSAKSEITIAEEWFLDNFHVVDEQLREIRDHLPRGYYDRLPKIASGHLAGTPRVYGLAWAYVAHTDSHFEIETLERFVRAYQRVELLEIGELWAVPIHLRMTLVENLRRLSNQIADSREARAAANVIGGSIARPEWSIRRRLRRCPASAERQALAPRVRGAAGPTVARSGSIDHSSTGMAQSQTGCAGNERY